MGSRNCPFNSVGRKPREHSQWYHCRVANCSEQSSGTREEEGVALLIAVEKREAAKIAVVVELMFLHLLILS